MIDKIKKEFLEELAELDTGKAQPLFHPYPVINIFREDEPLAVKKTEEKAEEEKLLKGMTGLICDASETVQSQISVRLKMEGAKPVTNENKLPENEYSQTENADFVIAMDSDAAFLKYVLAQGCPALKATYGLVSRFGMETDAPSLTQPAMGARNTAMIAKTLQAIAGVDNKDPMSRDAYIYEYLTALEHTDLTGMKIAIPEVLSGMEADEMQLGCYYQMLDVLEAKGAQIETVELDWVEYAVSVHEIIAACEKVMTADEIIMGCTDEDKSLLLGHYLLEEEQYETYYLKALKLRSLIKDSYDMLFRDYVLFLVPYTEKADPYSVAANLAGLPAMTIPFLPYDIEIADDEKMVAGLYMIAGANNENHLLKAAYTYEQEVL